MAGGGEGVVLAGVIVVGSLVDVRRRGSLRSGGRCNNRRIKWKNDFKIENLGNFRLKILGFLKCGAIKHK